MSDGARRPLSVLEALGRYVPARLVQGQAFGLAGLVGVEGDLRVDDPIEELRFRLGEDLELGLGGGLREQPGAVAPDGDDEARLKLVTSHVL